MLVLLAFFACTGSGNGAGDVTVTPPPVTPPPAEKKIPAVLLADTAPIELPSAPLVQKDCWGYARTKDRSAKTAAPPPTPKPSAAPSTASAPSGGAADAGGGGAPELQIIRGSKKESRDLGAATGASAPADAAPVATSAPAAAAPPAAEPSPAAGATASTTYGGDQKQAPPKAKKAQAEEKTADKTVMADPAKPVEEAERAEEAPSAYLDWGAKIYLSNDDSMSLASAQHLLHAVDKGNRFGVSEIRPHELLNYFSFDTKAPAEGELFSIVPSAEKTDTETLTVALAVKGATPPRRPLDLTVVLDISGSMAAEGRMEYTQRALNQAADQLQKGDRLDLVLFDDVVCTALQDFVVGRDDMGILKGEIAKLKPAGGTNISIGLKEAYRIVTADGRDQGVRRNRRVMLMTDASVNQGIIDKDVLAMVGEAYDKKGIRVTGVGVGVGFRDDILDEVTEKGKGGYVYLGSEAVVDRLFGVGFRSLTETIAHDVQFELDLPETLAMEKFYGEEASTDAADVQPIHYYAGTTQLFLQDLHVKPDLVNPKDPVVLTIRYRDALTGEPGEQRFDFTVGEMLDSDRHNLDKARALMAWTDLLTQQAMGGETCGAALRTYEERAAKVQDDAEIAYVNGLVGKKCTVNVPQLVTTQVATGVTYKVKVDSDVPIAEVALHCGSTKLTDKLSGSDTVAKFQAEPGASCKVVLQGAVAMEQSVQVPVTGGDLKCTVRGGRVSCG